MHALGQNGPGNSLRALSEANIPVEYFLPACLCVTMSWTPVSVGKQSLRHLFVRLLGVDVTHVVLCATAVVPVLRRESVGPVACLCPIMWAPLWDAAIVSISLRVCWRTLTM